MLKKIGDRMKKYEVDAENVRKLKNELPWIARLDGHCFHTFARSFRKPFDEILNKIMVLSTKDLVNEFKASTGYTQSDEITLIFPVRISESNNKPIAIPYGGKIMKISTLMSGYCSARFLYHSLKEKDNFPKDYKKYEKVMFNLTSGKASFDCRVFNLPSKEEIYNNIMWRMMDSKRNSILNLGRQSYSQKELNGVKTNELVEMLKKEKNVIYDNWPSNYRFGTFVKKELFDKEGYDSKEKKKVIVKRSRFVEVSFDIQVKFDESILKFLESKYVDQKFISSLKVVEVKK